jgi:hypothetical protein
MSKEAECDGVLCLLMEKMRPVEIVPEMGRNRVVNK